MSASIEGLPEAIRSLELIAERVADTGPWTDGVYAEFLAIEKRRFDAEGPGWAALAASTVAAKGSSRILVDTGKLEASLTDQGAEGAVFQPIFTAGFTQVTMGTDYHSPSQTGAWADTALAAFHQYGTSKMPARPVIDDDVQIAAAAREGLAAWLLTGEIAALKL